MARSVYVASVEGHTAKSVVALGVLETLTKKFQKVGVFRAISEDPSGHDAILELLMSNTNTEFAIEDCVGVSYREMHETPEKSLGKILERYKALEASCDAVVVVGSDYTDVFSPAEFSFNARVAANLGIPMILVFNGREIHTTSEHLGQAKPRNSQDLKSMAELVMQEVADAHTTILAAVVNRADSERLQSIKEAVGKALPDSVPVWVVPEDPHLPAPRMGQILEAVDGKLLFGSGKRLTNEAMDLVVAAMTPEHVLQRISEGSVVVVPADRTDVLLALLMADASKTFPSLAGIVLNGGFEIPEPIRVLIEGLDPTLPVVTTDGRSFDTTVKISSTRGLVSARDLQKIERARKLVVDHLDTEQLVDLLEQTTPRAITPLFFEYSLLKRASDDQKTIVLPEGDDDRVLAAASQILGKKIAKLIILGDPQQIQAKANALGLDLSAASLMDPAKSEHFAACVAEYVKLRSHKGVTEEKAKEVMLDVSYFGTMLVQLGLADGMVSGAAHTTAHTIKPSFEFIKAKPGVSAVSSVFLMALEDRVLVYGDCAVIPEPSVEELADIAISSAETARSFNIEPHVAMLSYSTGESGSGADVDRVRAATKLVRERAPELSVEGPIQYDAAVDVAVAKAKLPESTVAGRATVFVFPDLNTGNNTYKAVQRTAGALAIGPILQGLNKPVNDLSRGALVQDIVNTIAITAIQAQSMGQK
ncbi:MAG: phosphate acetyltransferase [Aquiluna sp.]|nr:phosphate acetyltransferase [Aquiluna sp.]MCF8546198.1 phosphate acetyltransferase [Aquiluna sp.]